MEKIKLRFHLAICKTCPSFTKRNTQLTSICDKANLESLSELQKEAMKKELESKV